MTRFRPELCGPGGGGVRGSAEGADAPGGVLDDGPRRTGAPRSGCGSRRSHRRAGRRPERQEAGPGCALPLGCGRNAVLVQDLPVGGGGDRRREPRVRGGSAGIRRKSSPGPGAGRERGSSGRCAGTRAASARRSRRGAASSGRGASAAACPGVPAAGAGATCPPGGSGAARRARDQSGERGLPGLVLQDDELVPQRQDLDVLVLIAHGQQAHERERVRHGEVGQAQQHDRSRCRESSVHVSRGGVSG